MIVLPAPAQIDGGVLAAEIEAAGFTGVEVTLVGDQIEVRVDGLADPMPTVEEREAAMQAALVSCIADAHTRAEAANAEVRDRIAPVVAAHVPPPSSEPTPAEKIAALGLTPEDLKAVLG